MLKFGTAQGLRVTSAVLIPQQASRGELRAIAHRHHFDYEPRLGYLYVRSRAISSRCNDNFDEFPAAEIKKAYRSFVGKPVFVNHNNDDHQRARGVIIDAALHEDRNPDGSPDTWAEVLMEVDAMRFPRLAKELLAGNIDRTSMGTDVKFSVCSVCNNRAENPAEYCAHIPRMKGQRIYRTTASGSKEGVLVREICYGLGFFENSLLVEEPADPTAYTFGLDARGLSMQASVDMNARANRAVDQGQGMEVTFAEKLHITPFTASKQFDARELTAFAMASAIYGIEVEAGGKGFDYPNPGDHPSLKHVSAQNIIDKYHSATQQEKDNGDHWYSDAKIVAKKLAGKHGVKVGAGVLSSYSPRTTWSLNTLHAARALDSGQAHGGPGQGAMEMQRNPAQKYLDAGKDSDHDSILKSPKTNKFAKLIEHGGMDEHNPTVHSQHVVIDRHALSVATGSRANSEELDKAPLGEPHYYNHVEKAYQEAARHLSVHYGREIAPHQVQAATWLAQQRENRQADIDSGDRKGKGRVTREKNDIARWHNHVNETYGEDHGLGMHGPSRETGGDFALASLHPIYGGADPDRPWMASQEEYEARASQRPAREARLPHIVQDTSSREHGTTYKAAPEGTKGSFPAHSPEDEYHGPYEVVKHPDTGMHHVVDNQGRKSGYGPRDGEPTQARAEMHRDHADYRQSSKEKAKGVGESLWNGIHEIMDPGGTDESRRSERNMQSASDLLHSYPPHQIKHDPDDMGGEPYGETKHPSGWTARDYGGDRLHIHHEATGEDAHDVLHISGGAQGHMPWDANSKPAGFDHNDAYKHLHNWVGEVGEDYAEHADPRIKPWQRRNGYKPGDGAPEKTVDLR